jgi:hypothetical protein
MSWTAQGAEPRLSPVSSTLLTMAAVTLVEAGVAAAYLTHLGIPASRASLLSFLDAERVMSLVGGTLSTAAGVLPQIVLMPLLVFFALAEIVGFGDIGSVVEPKVLGRTLGLSPLIVLLTMVFWGWLWGPVGTLLSVPLTMIAKIVFENSSGLRWVAVLIGPAEKCAAQPGRGSLVPAMLRPLVRRGTPVGLGAGTGSLVRASSRGPVPPAAAPAHPAKTS